MAVAAMNCAGWFCLAAKLAGFMGLEGSERLTLAEHYGEAVSQICWCLLCSAFPRGYNVNCIKIN